MDLRLAQVLVGDLVEGGDLQLMRWIRSLIGGAAAAQPPEARWAGAPDEATYQLGVMSVGLLAAEDALEIVRSGNYDPEVEPEGRWRDMLINEVALDEYASEIEDFIREMRDYHLDYNMKTRRPMPKDDFDLVTGRIDAAAKLRALLQANQTAMRTAR